jgi:hypothetical protein
MDYEVDYLSIVGPDGVERVDESGAHELVRYGVARHALLDPDGKPRAAAQAAQDAPFSRWTLSREGRAAGVVEPPTADAHPPQAEPEVVRVETLEERILTLDPPAGPKAWTLVTRAPATAKDDLAAMLYPAARVKRASPAPGGQASQTGYNYQDAHGATDLKAKKLNQEAWVKGVFADVGGYQGAATRFFEASNSNSVFDTVSFPGAAESRARWPRGAESDVEHLKGILAQELPRLGEQKLHRRFGVVTQADEQDGALVGRVALRLEDAPKSGTTSDVIVEFAFRGGNWRQRRNALANLGVNLLYAARFVPAPDAFARTLREDMPAKVQADVALSEASGKLANLLR